MGNGKLGQRLFIGLFSFVLFGDPALPAVEPTRKDVRYGKYDRNVLDVYQANSDRPTPVVIHFHGGGFVGGDKRSVDPEPFLAEGISVISANYRFTMGTPDAAPFPASMEDGARVVQFIRSRAAEWNLDPRRVALTGVSAGAVISMWIAYQDDLADQDAADEITRQSTRVQCLVPIAGPTTMDVAWIRKNVGGRPEIHPAVFPLFAVARISDLQEPDVAKQVQAASPTTYVTADDPPTFLLYGSRLDDAPLPENADFNDSIHHARFGLLIKQQCDALGVPCYFAYRGHEAKIDQSEFYERYLVKAHGADQPAK